MPVDVSVSYVYVLLFPTGSVEGRGRPEQRAGEVAEQTKAPHVETGESYVCIPATTTALLLPTATLIIPYFTTVKILLQYLG